MSSARSHPVPPAAFSPLAALAIVVIAVATLFLAGCGTPSGASTEAPATPVKTAIIKLLPRDAAAEPPWNGRFVQVNVRVAVPGKMDPDDWRVFVNGAEPELAQLPSILPYSATEAVVAFMFQAPYSDPGTYEFRVAYTPTGAAKVQKSWEYKW